jgi:DNA-binding transcriptional MocR family regulator
VLITSGSLQALDLVNAALLAPGDTVLIEQASYQGSLNRLTRLGVNAVGIPLDSDGMRIDTAATFVYRHAHQLKLGSKALTMEMSAHLCWVGIRPAVTAANSLSASTPFSSLA